MVLSLLACSEDEGPNRSPDAPQSGLPPFAGRVEMPALRQDPMSLFIVHQTPVDGRDVINYSLEYDCLNRHARWVAFTFYDVTAKNSGSRTDAWDDDPDVPEQYRSGREDYRGYVAFGSVSKLWCRIGGVIRHCATHSMSSRAGLLIQTT